MTFYGFVKGLFRALFNLKGWQIQGLPNLPQEGPVILAVNHLSFWDPVLVGCGLNRQVSYMAKEELFNVPLLGWVIRQLGAFPVKRTQSDTGAIRQALVILKQNRVLGLFPEGTRSKTGEIQKGMPGMILLMEKAQAPVVPIRVYGTKNLLTRRWGKIGLVIGEPLTAEMLKAPEGIDNRREWAAGKIMEAIEAL
ncbi:MAG: lysophospholipid acyltransferase family protein [Desulfitobacteriaceae bacterium]